MCMYESVDVYVINDTDLYLYWIVRVRVVNTFGLGLMLLLGFSFNLHWFYTHIMTYDFYIIN